MINPVTGPQTETLMTMTNEELATEGMAMTLMCAMTSSGRQQLRGILDAFTGDVTRQNEVGALLLESVFRHNCASMVYACMPMPTMEVMDALEEADKEVLRQRADGVVEAMRLFGLPANFVEDFAANNVPHILSKYNAVIDTIAALRESDTVWPEDARERILQMAFETGNPQGVISYEAACSAENIDRPVSH